MTRAGRPCGARSRCAFGELVLLGARSHGAAPAGDSREACVVRTEAAEELPRLYRRANAATLNLGPGRNQCAALKEVMASVSAGSIEVMGAPS